MVIATPHRLHCRADKRLSTLFARTPHDNAWLLLQVQVASSTMSQPSLVRRGAEPVGSTTSGIRAGVISTNSVKAGGTISTTCD